MRPIGDTPRESLVKRAFARFGGGEVYGSGGTLAAKAQLKTNVSDGY